MTDQHPGKAQPTLGYPTQGAAIEALWMAGVEPYNIIVLTGASVTSVYRTIANYKRKHGIRLQPPSKPPKEPTNMRHGDVWSMNDYDRALALHQRARKAAREARLTP